MRCSRSRTLATNSLDGLLITNIQPLVDPGLCIARPPAASVDRRICFTEPVGNSPTNAG
jgi:hypothetical protein